MFNIFLPLIISVYMQATSITLPDQTSLTVVQQPGGETNWISWQTGTATQFDAALKSGVLGFLAHNTREGQRFLPLLVGDIVTVELESGEIRHYRITKIDQYHFLYHMYIDPENGQRFDAGFLFDRYYIDLEPGYRRLVFQTYLGRDDFSVWGRVFFVAEMEDP